MYIQKANLKEVGKIKGKILFVCLIYILLSLNTVFAQNQREYIIKMRQQVEIFDEKPYTRVWIQILICI